MGAGAAIQAMRDLGLRHVISLTLSDKNYEETIPLGETAASLTEEIKRMSASEAKPTQAWLDDCEEFIDTFHDPDKLTTCCPGPSAVQRCSDELLQGAADIARKRNLPMHIHLAETKAQAVMGKQLYGTSLLQTFGFARVSSARIFLWPTRFGSSRQYRTFCQERRDAGAQSCEQPAHRQRPGSGSRVLSAGVNVALGTDGAASNDGQNMFDALRLVALIHNQAGTDFNHWVTPVTSTGNGHAQRRARFRPRCRRN